MTPTKDDLRINESGYFKEVYTSGDTSKFLLKRDEICDPGRVSTGIGYPHDVWKVILRYNKVVDPFEDLSIGRSLDIPSQDDFNALVGL